VARFILDEAIRLVFREVVISLDSSLLEQWIGTLALLLFLVPVVACVAGVLPGMGIGAFTGMLIRCTLHLWRGRLSVRSSMLLGLGVTFTLAVWVNSLFAPALLQPDLGPNPERG
jgi:hypothetical protein